MSQTQSNWKISWKYGERHRIVAVHPAPACGTASKAKEKKLVSWAKKGFEIPQPPRSAQKPVEVDGLEGLDKTGQRQTHAATARIVRFCVQHDAVFGGKPRKLTVLAFSGHVRCDDRSRRL